MTLPDAPSLEELLKRVEAASLSMGLCHNEPVFDEVACDFADTVTALLAALLKAVQAKGGGDAE